MVKEEERIFQGIVFCPGDPELVALKLRTHNLNVDYNNTYEDEYEKRAAILGKSWGRWGRETRIQGAHCLPLWQAHQNRPELFRQLQPDHPG